MDGSDAEGDSQRTLAWDAGGEAFLDNDFLIATVAETQKPAALTQLGVAARAAAETVQSAMDPKTFQIDALVDNGVAELVQTPDDPSLRISLRRSRKLLAEDLNGSATPSCQSSFTSPGRQSRSRSRGRSLGSLQA